MDKKLYFCLKYSNNVESFLHIQSSTAICILSCFWYATVGNSRVAFMTQVIPSSKSTLDDNALK